MSQPSWRLGVERPGFGATAAPQKLATSFAIVKEFVKCGAGIRAQNQAQIPAHGCRIPGTESSPDSGHRIEPGFRDALLFLVGSLYKTVMWSWNLGTGLMPDSGHRIKPGFRHMGAGFRAQNRARIPAPIFIERSRQSMWKTASCDCGFGGTPRSSFRPQVCLLALGLRMCTMCSQAHRPCPLSVLLQPDQS